MNKFISRLIIPAAALCALAACDNVNENERYVPVDPVEAIRVVLLEDFTGQNCINCPDAHEKIEQMQQQHPGSIIAVSIHGGDFAISKKRTNYDTDYIGLATEEGQAYNDANKIDEWPSGIINRRSGVLGRNEWADAVDKELQRPADVTINLAAHLEGEDIKIDLTFEPQADIDGTVNVWILESGITARQRDASGKIIRDYVHNNVFRATVTDLNGDALALQNGIHRSLSYSIPMRYNDQERWVAENLSVVAFVTDASGVHQAAIVPVIAPETDTETE